MDSVFRKVMVADRLPKESDGALIFMPKRGNTYQRHCWDKFTEEELRERFYAFLVEIELPTEECIYKTAEEEHKFNHRNIDEISFILGFEEGAKHILNTLKGGSE